MLNTDISKFGFYGEKDIVQIGWISPPPRPRLLLQEKEHSY